MMSRLLLLLRQQKYRRRAQLVLANSLNQIILILFSPLLSFLVIRSTSLELWGQFVGVLIVVQLGAHIATWGNKEFLLRAFSRNPAEIAPLWRRTLIMRAPLLLPLVILLGWLYPRAWWPFLLLWLLGLFVYQSYDVLIVYKKHFGVAALVELASLLLMVAAVVFVSDALRVLSLIALFGLVHLGKGLFYSLFYRRDLGPAKGYRQPEGEGSVSLQYFVLAFPFFLLGFSGMLQSRIDLYAVNIFLTPEDVAQYQVFINFLIYFQAVAGFILLPFVKSIYRLQYSAIPKLSRRLFAAGLLLVTPALLAVHLLLTQLYGIFLAPAFYLWGGLYVLPIYYFLPTIYALYKAERQRQVIYVNLFGIGLNFLLDMILLPWIGLEGAILAAAVVKWLVFFIYFRTMRSLTQQRESWSAQEVVS